MHHYAQLLRSSYIFVWFFFFILVLLNSLKILFWRLALSTLCFSQGAERTS